MSVRREGMPEVDETPKVKVLQEVDRPRLLKSKINRIYGENPLGADEACGQGSKSRLPILLLMWPRSSEAERAAVNR